MPKPHASLIAAVMLLALTSGARADVGDATPPAAQQMQVRIAARFHRADVNGDGQLTLAEAQQGMPRVYQHFSQIDTDNKGYVTLAQVEGFVAAQMAARHARAGSAASEPPPSP